MEEIWIKEIEQRVNEGENINTAISAVQKIKEEYCSMKTKLYSMKQPAGTKLLDLFEKLNEEVNEIFAATTDENLSEEIFDSIQILLNICAFLDIDMTEETYKHNQKLIGRGWNFEKEIMSVGGER